MIDFRYHLVSLVSVFLALAVGIALGAGPLKGPIDAGLRKNVDSLRQEKADMHDDLVRLEASQQRRDNFIEQVSPVLVKQQLGGRSVVIVTLPGADSETVDQLVSTLQQAGARVTSRIGVAEDWASREKAAFREQLATQLQAGISETDLVGAETPARLAALLAKAVVTDDLTASGKLDGPARTTMEGLSSGDLITVDGKLESRATEAVVVAPPIPEATGATPSSAAAKEAGDPRIWTALTAALDKGSDGAVVLGPASSAGEGGLVKAVRDDSDLERRVSTVDTAGTPMGTLTTVLALNEQLKGVSGAYGFAEGAQRVLPELAGTPQERS